MKTKIILYFAFCFILLISTGCDALPFPGVVTVAPPGLTRIAVPSVTPLVLASPTPEPLSTRKTEPFPTPPELTATPAPSTGSVVPVRYTLDVLFSYDSKSLGVTETIEYTNTTGETLKDIVFAVEPNMIPGAILPNFVKVDGKTAMGTEGDAIINNTTWEGQKLTINLQTPLETGQIARIEIGYRLYLPRIEQGDPNVIRPQIFGYTDRQVNLTDWYPMIVPYEAGKGWKLHDPWYYGEHLVYPLANFDVSLRFTDPANIPLIAASAAAEPIDGGARYMLENGRDFALAMGRQLTSISADVDGVTVTSYYYPGAENAGQAVLDATIKALQTYSAFFGPYPHKTLSAVQGDFNDGMEFDGLYYLSNSFYNLYDGTDKNYLVMVAAHEASHQWWFGRVANDQSTQPWLDESLATYCEKLFYEKNDPESVKWWWDYRINFYQPYGKIDGDVASYGGFTPYTNATYRQGARFLDELRQAIGDEAFFAFLKDYASKMDGKIATSVDFFRILREHTQVDISSIIVKYFKNIP